MADTIFISATHFVQIPAFIDNIVPFLNSPHWCHHHHLMNETVEPITLSDRTQIHLHLARSLYRMLHVGRIRLEELQLILSESETFFTELQDAIRDDSRRPKENLIAEFAMYNFRFFFRAFCHVSKQLLSKIFRFWA
jgi:hypothetical protein